MRRLGTNLSTYFVVATVISAMFDLFQLRPLKARVLGELCGILSVVVAGGTLFVPVAIAEQTSPNCSGGVTIHGRVLSFDGKPVSNAIVRLERKLSPGAVETKSNAKGDFAFASLSVGSYRLSAEQAGARSAAIDVGTSAETCTEKVDLVFQGAGVATSSNAPSGPVGQAMEFADQPNFSIAGVTDSTAVGGHGSDSTLRTSESLASETRNLKSERAGHDGAGAPGDIRDEVKSESALRAALSSAPGSFDANHRLGEFYLHERRYPEAIALLETANKIDPINSGNQYDLVLDTKKAAISRRPASTFMKY